MRVFGHLLIVLFLTLLTQIGGLAWILALIARRGLRRILVFLATFDDHIHMQITRLP